MSLECTERAVLYIVDLYILDGADTPPGRLQSAANKHDILVADAEAVRDVREVEAAVQVLAHVVDDVRPRLDVFRYAGRIEGHEGAGISGTSKPP